jgi:hypothetical protein
MSIHRDHFTECTYQCTLVYILFKKDNYEVIDGQVNRRFVVFCLRLQVIVGTRDYSRLVQGRRKVCNGGVYVAPSTPDSLRISKSRFTAERELEVDALKFFEWD